MSSLRDDEVLARRVNAGQLHYTAREVLMAQFFKTFPPADVLLVDAQRAAAMVQDADLFFACGSDLAAKFIHIVTDSPISHTGFLFRDSAGMHTVESTFTKGVHIGDARSYLDWGDGPCLIARLKGIEAADQARIIAQARALVGRHYEVAEEIAMAMHSVFPFVRVKPDWTDLYCSGLIEEVLSNTRWPIPLDSSGGNATPVDVWIQNFVEPVCAIQR